MKNQPSQYPNAEEGLNLNEARGWQRKVMQMQAVSLFTNYVLAEHLNTPKDYRQSFRWYLKAAEQGMSKAQAQVAFMYAYGQGVTKDLAESYAWYNIALENEKLITASERMEKRASTNTRSTRTG